MNRARCRCAPARLRRRRDASAARVELDARTCECCQAALARTPRWTRRRVARPERRRSPGHRRLARQENGRWSAPRIVSADSWEHRACPVNGPALVADGRRVDLVWFTGVGGQNRVWLVRSTDGARTFGAAHPRSMRARPSGAWTPSRWVTASLLVAWLEGTVRPGRRVAGPPRDRGRERRTVPRASPPSPVPGWPDFRGWPARWAPPCSAYTAPGPDGGVRVVRLDPARWRPNFSPPWAEQGLPQRGLARHLFAILGIRRLRSPFEDSRPMRLSRLQGRLAWAATGCRRPGHDPSRRGWRRRPPAAWPAP